MDQLANLNFDWSVGIGWLVGRIALLLLLLVIARTVRAAFRRVLPRVIKTAVVRSARGVAGDELAKRYETLSGVTVKTFEVAVWAIFAIMALSLLGQDIKPILAGVGIIGIAIGFGAQGLVKDVIAGLFVLLENQYGKGDFVNIAGVGGYVEDVNLRRTVLRDRDGTVHNIPNGEVRIASNRTRDWSRVSLNIRVSYDEDLNNVMAIIDRAGEALAADKRFGPLILEAPKALHVEAFEELGIAIRIDGTTKPGKQWEVAGELRKRLKEAFDASGVELSRARRLVAPNPATPSTVSEPPGI